MSLFLAVDGSSPFQQHVVCTQTTDGICEIVPCTQFFASIGSVFEIQHSYRKLCEYLHSPPFILLARRWILISVYIFFITSVPKYVKSGGLSYEFLRMCHCFVTENLFLS